jgi:OOP family OmpA-OmpF porin
MKPASRLSAMAFAVFACASSAALAENGTGFYVGGGVGYAGQRINCDRASDCSNSHTGAKLLAGYQIMPNLAIESSYGYTGRSTASGYGMDGSIKTHSFTVAALGLYPVSKEVELFGKLGMHFTKTRFDANYLGQSVSDSFNGNGLLAGVGAQYRFTPKLIGRVEYEYLNRGVRAYDARADINLVTASVIYQF